jgi:hypothetical protein
VPGIDPSVVPAWPGDRFDVVWRFDRTGAPAGYTFSQVPQQLLAADRPTGI